MLGVPWDTLLTCQNLQRGEWGPSCPAPTCLMAASFLGSLSGELAAAEGICVTDVLAFGLGG